MTDLEALVIFGTVAEAKSFSEAARRLNMATSTISRRISELEDQLGVRLLERSTRGLRVTDTGAELLEHARRTVEISDAVENIASYQKSNVTGLLRLAVSPRLCDGLIVPLIESFQATYPSVRIQILVTERFVEHIAEGIDLVFRLGTLKDSALVARRILTYRHQLLASPRYLSQCEPPRQPRDLLRHRLLAFSEPTSDNTWIFERTTGHATEQLTFSPQVAMNDYGGLAAALLAGAGIGELPPIVQPELVREGRLVEVMPEWHFRACDLSIVHLGNRHTPRHVLLFKELAATMAPTLFAALPT